jgi:membrane protein
MPLHEELSGNEVSEPRPNSPAPAAGASGGPATTHADRVPTEADHGRAARSRARVTEHAKSVRQRYEGSSAEHLWQRLNALDFINQAMQFAGLLLVTFLPFLIVVSSLAGHNAATTLGRHMGLNRQATAIVAKVLNPASKTAAVLDIRGIIFAVLGGIGTAATLQAIYERIYNLPSRGMKDFHRQLMWIVAVLGVSTLAGWALPEVRAVSFGPILLGVTGFALELVFWWFTMWLLVSRRVPWRGLLQPAIATSAFWTGLGVFSKFYFSSTIIGDYHEYGSLGVAFAIMSWLIAVGVVIILGAVVGIIWQEEGLTFSAAFRRLLQSRRRRGTPA